MGFVNYEHREKFQHEYKFEPELIVCKGYPNDELNECEKAISRLKKDKTFSLTILVATFLMVFILPFIGVIIFVPEMRVPISAIVFPIYSIFVVGCGIFDLCRRRVYKKKIKLVKEKGIFFKEMQCSGMEKIDDEAIEYYLQFDEVLVCKTDKDGYDMLDVGDNCVLVFIKEDKGIPILCYGAK